MRSGKLYVFGRVASLCAVLFVFGGSFGLADDAHPTGSGWKDVGTPTEMGPKRRCCVVGEDNVAIGIPLMRLFLLEMRSTLNPC